MTRGKVVAVVLRGLRGALRGPSAGRRGLDGALRCAAARRRNAAGRWGEAAGEDEKKRSALPASSVRTLQHLVSAGGETRGLSEDAKNAALQEREEGQQISLTFFEKQQARLHTALQQWIVYAGFRCSQAEFVARRSEVMALLLLLPSRVVPSSRSSSAGANSLEASIRRRGAQAYVDLLVHHRLSVEKEEEWEALCALGSPTKEPQQSGGKGNEIRVMALPLVHSFNLDASWERGLAVLSWAMHFNGRQKQQQPCRHISSVDIANVLEQYVQHFGERMRVPGLSHDGDNGGSVILGDGTEQAVTTQLQRWWMAARTAEQQNSKLAEACRLDRTAPSRIHVEGKKVTLVSSAETSAISDTLFAELLLQGSWEKLLHHIQRVATETVQRHNSSAGAQLNEQGEGEDVACIAGEENEERCFTVGATALSSSVSTDDVLGVFFNRSRPLIVKNKLWIHTTASRLGRVPRALLDAVETPAETELLQNPLTAGLRCRPCVTGEGGEPQRKGCVNNNNNNNSAALTELRRKMWIYGQLPRHVSRSLVRFEGTRTAMLPYLQRCPAKELAPWFLLGNIAAVAREQQWEKVQKALQRARAQILYTLFLPVTFYAAFQEYCADLVVQLGSLLASPQVMRLAVRTFFSPPLFCHFYDVLKGRRVHVEVTCRQLWWGSLEAANDAERKKVSSSSFSKTAITGMERLRSDFNTLCDFFTCKASSLRNYHVSTWIESCSKVETLDGLLDLLVQEVNNYGPPLLSPEAAAALLTAVLLPHVAATREKRVDANAERLRELGVVYFVVPADRVFGAASYFKGTYHERYITPTAMDWAASWNGAEALLAGRSIRRSTKYPTTTKEIFFRVDQRRLGGHPLLPTLTFRVPELRLRLMTLDLLEARRHFVAHEQQEGKETGLEVKTTTATTTTTNEETATASLAKSIESEGKPAIVARHLPFGVMAVYKPAGVSTTLHVGYPHLIDFLARCVPWKGAGVPVLFQHGLVNRIDVGTSGLVLVTDAEASLVAARRASVVDRCIEKTYRALVVHCPPPASRVGAEECWYLSPKGIITRNVLANGADYSLQLASRDSQKKNGLPLASTDCRPATTMYRVLRYFPTSGVYDVEVRLCSGRRHQIRQHFAQLWHPLVGDGRYHERAKSVGERLGLYRPALHASRITLLAPFCDGAGDEIDGSSHMTTGGDLEKTVVECPLPDDMQRALQRLQEEEERRIGAPPV